MKPPVQARPLASETGEYLQERVEPDTLPDAGQARHAKIQALLSRQALTADRIWTRREWTKLCLHLHNDNPPDRFVMGFRDKKTGNVKYVRSKRKKADCTIQWSWCSIAMNPPSRIAFVPYSINQGQLSRWGGIDFDAHDPAEAEHARNLAFSAFQLLLNEDLFLILESSGRGWHLWAITEEFLPVQVWIKKLKRVAEQIGAHVQSGICEIFPPDTLNDGFGKGMRAPGSWNPRTDTRNEIYWQNISPLLARLNTDPVQCHLTDIERNYSFSSSFSLEERFRITKPSQRNALLGQLVGHVFHQVSFNIARRLAEAQFNGKTVATNASLEQHLTSFEKYWNGLERKWPAELSEPERQRYGHLGETDRDAFRIVRSFANLASKMGDSDFPVAAQNFADRLGITLQGACDVRRRLVRAGVISQTQPFVPNKRAARFSWTYFSSDL